MKVDFPQPDGPMSAVTECFGKDMFTPSSTLRGPNHTLTFRASSSVTMAGAGVVISASRTSTLSNSAVDIACSFSIGPGARD